MRKNSALRKEQPDVVKRAIAENDTPLLSILGRKGAMQAGDNREARKAFGQHLAQKRAEERAVDDMQLRVDTNEHIVPIDPEDDAVEEKEDVNAKKEA